MIRSVIRTLIGALMLLGGLNAAACGRQREAFLMVQLCPGGEAGEADLKQLFQNAARDSGLAFLDGRPGEFSLKGPIGRWVVVSHAGAAENQMVIAFFESPRETQIHDVAKAVMPRLKARWAVETIPPGQAAQPKACPA